MAPIQIAYKYNSLFENADDMIYVHFEDTDGYMHYEYFDDPTKQVYTMTRTQFQNQNFRKKYYTPPVE